MKTVKPSCFFDCHDSNIHDIRVLGIVVVRGKTYCSNGIQDYNEKDFWFRVRLYNEGKCRTGRFAPAGFSVAFGYCWNNIKTGNWVWYDHHYLIHNDFDLYHHVNDEFTWNAVHIGQPMLGPQNRIKIKTAIKKWLKTI